MRKCRLVMLLGSVILIGGCSNGETTTQPAQDVAVKDTKPTLPTTPVDDDPINSSDMPGRIHQVVPGDTLFSLAEKYYGNGNQWRRIVQANKRRLSNPKDLPVGMKLIIP